MIHSSTQTHVTRSQSLKDEKKEKKRYLRNRSPPYLVTQFVAISWLHLPSPGYFLWLARWSDAGTCADAQHLTAFIRKFRATAQAMHLAAELWDEEVTKLWGEEEQVTYECGKVSIHLQEERMNCVMRKKMYFTWMS